MITMLYLLSNLLSFTSLLPVNIIHFELEKLQHTDVVCKISGSLFETSSCSEREHKVALLERMYLVFENLLKKKSQNISQNEEKILNFPLLRSCMNNRSR